MKRNDAVFFNVILVLFYNTIPCTTLGISSKLDFGDSSGKGIVSGTEIHKPTENAVHYQGDSKKFNEILCASENCKTSKLDNSSVETDVLVHVKTRVNLGNGDNKTTQNFDDTDVPIIVGLAGTSSTTNGQNFDIPYSSTVPPPLANRNKPFTSSFVPSFNPSFSDDQLVDSNIDDRNSEGHYIDVNIKAPPPLAVTMRDPFKDIRYQTNGIQAHYPYFEPSFNNHYFGEHPPPQIVWYPKSIGVNNPVEFKHVNRAPVWKPEVWIVQHRTSNHHNHKHVPEGCSCNNQDQPQQQRGLQWYPRSNPGAQINDKLAPLN